MKYAFNLRIQSCHIKYFQKKKTFHVSTENLIEKKNTKKFYLKPSMNYIDIVTEL